jgi:homoserine O-acetyltransferase
LAESRTGKIVPTVEHDVHLGPFVLDCGATLPDAVQRVSIYGTPRTDGANVALVNHALTGSSRVADWWGEIAGPGKLLDTSALAVVGVNALGSCYGSSGAGALVSVRDMVRAQRAAVDALGIERFAVVAGGSLGGMQAIEWAMQAPERVGHVVAIGAYDHFSAMGIALNAVAREAIAIAANPAEGVALARKIAMLTYKSEALFAQRHGRKFDRKGGDPTRDAADRFDIEGYLDYQGALFAERMEPRAYLTLTRAMDLFDTRDRVLQKPYPAFTFVGISSDWLFLPEYVRASARRFSDSGANSAYLELTSNHGHDAFLADPRTLRALVAPRLAGLYAALAASTV